MQPGLLSPSAEVRPESTGTTNDAGTTSIRGFSAELARAQPGREGQGSAGAQTGILSTVEAEGLSLSREQMQHLQRGNALVGILSPSNFTDGGTLKGGGLSAGSAKGMPAVVLPSGAASTDGSGQEIRLQSRDAKAMPQSGSGEGSKRVRVVVGTLQIANSKPAPASGSEGTAEGSPKQFGSPLRGGAGKEETSRPSTGRRSSGASSKGKGKTSGKHDGVGRTARRARPAGGTTTPSDGEGTTSSEAGSSTKGSARSKARKGATNSANAPNVHAQSSERKGARPGAQPTEGRNGQEGQRAASKDGARSSRRKTTVTKAVRRMTVVGGTDGREASSRNDGARGAARNNGNNGGEASVGEQRVTRGRFAVESTPRGRTQSRGGSPPSPKGRAQAAAYAGSDGSNPGATAGDPSLNQNASLQKRSTDGRQKGEARQLSLADGRPQSSGGRKVHGSQQGGTSKGGQGSQGGAQNGTPYQSGAQGQGNGGANERQGFGRTISSLDVSSGSESSRAPSSTDAGIGSTKPEPNGKGWTAALSDTGRGQGTGKGGRAGSSGPPRTLPSAWLNAAKQAPMRTVELSGGWKAMELALGKEKGTVTVKARQGQENVAVSLGFSESRVQAQLVANARQLQDAMQAQYGTDVDLSFSGGSADESDTQTSDSSAPDRSVSSASEEAPTDEDGGASSIRRRGRREWIG